MIGTVYFVVCALTALCGAVAVVASRSPIRSAVGLLTTILGIAGLFLRLDAQFLAAIQVIVYAGAVVILFVFVIMLLGSDAAATGENRGRIAAWLGAGSALVVTGGAIYLLAPARVTLLQGVGPGYGSVEAVGRQLFTTALVPFELSTALLVVALLAAVAVARGPSRRKLKKDRVENPTARLFGGPVHPRDATEPLAKELSR